MKTPSRQFIVAAILSAILWTLTGCETPSRSVSSVTYEPIGTAMHNGQEISIIDARQVMCDRTAVPVYPTEAHRNGLSGVGVVRVVVDRTGEIIDSFIVSSSPTDEFGQAALNAVKRWKFYPVAGLDGHPMVYMVEQAIVFERRNQPPVEQPRMGTGWNGL